MQVKANPQAVHQSLVCMALLFWVSLLAGCGVSGVPLTVSIPSLASEDLAGPCVFDLSISHPSALQRGTLVLYQRGDTADLYDDATLRKTMADLDYSILWAHQCNAKSTGDIQSDAAQGPARVLYAALTQLSVESGHPELATNGIILYGFSAAGVLTASMANDQPGRLLGTIQYAAGSSYVDLDNITVTSAAAHIPTLILANADDTQSGTERSLDYFQRGRSLGASWAYAVQRNTTHCCTLSTSSIILPWIEDIANLPPAPMPGATANATPAPPGTIASFVCTPDGVEDAQGYVDCEFSTSSVGPPASSAEESGWLPSQATANAWLTWVRNLSTN